MKSFICDKLPSRWMAGINKWFKVFSPEIEKELEEYWKENIPKVPGFSETSTKKSWYILSMFPYPSGTLHMGHVRVYAVGDVLARYFRMKGNNVLHPMGWDAFGLPAENAALERGLDPDTWTQDNIASMKLLMEELNFSFDWDRETATCDSDYYKWTQFLFLKLYECGLAYRKNAFVNWDPVDQTVLADEQVDAQGRSWRSGALVEKKLMKQWFVRTTRYAKRLMEGLSNPNLTDWEDVIKMQKNWIGIVNGTTIDFEIVDEVSLNERKVMPIWLNCPEYIHKAKFVAVKSQSFWTFGCDVEGIMPYSVRNPFTADILPVYLTNAVDFPKGSDTYLGIPEIYEIDKAFADSVGISSEPKIENFAMKEEILDLREKICAEAREKGIGGYSNSSNLKDWLISRQRYWGTPIPIVYCENCGEQPVLEKDLPVRLPKVKSIKKGQNALKEAKDWVNTTCPKCGGQATRETDTMDTFFDSSWYYFRYVDPDNSRAPFAVDKVKKLMPVDIYIGGKEHATLHLYYARFMSHFLHSMGLISEAEPFKKLLCHGMVKAETFSCPKTGAYVNPNLVEMKDNKPVHKTTGEVLLVNWEKMSKSKHNSVNPQDLLKKYGVDTVRLAVLSGPSFFSDLLWSENCIYETIKWQNRLWLTVAKFIDLRKKVSGHFEETEEFKKLDYFIFDSRNYYVGKISNTMFVKQDVATVISKLRGLTSSLRKCNDDVFARSLQFERALAAQLIWLAPVAPYFVSELWAGFTAAQNKLCHTGEILWHRSVFEQPFPEVDKNYQPRSTQVTDMLKLLSPKTKRQRKEEKLARKKAAKQEIEERLNSFRNLES